MAQADAPALDRSEARLAALRQSALFVATGSDRSGVFSDNDDAFAEVAQSLPGLTANLGSPAGQGPSLRGGGQEGRGDQYIGG